MRRVLVVQTAHLGDIVLTTPLLRALARDGESRTTLLTTAVGANLLGGERSVAETLVWRKTGDVGAGTAAIVRELWRRGFDVAVAAQRSLRSGLFVLASRAPVRIGFAGAPGAPACNRRVVWEAGRPAVERYLALAGAAGAPASADTRPQLSVCDRARERARELLAAAGPGAARPYVCLAPGAAWGTKRWLPEGFAGVAGHCARRGLVPVLVGTTEERGLCQEVADRSAAHIVILAGRTDPAELAAVLAGAALLVANDSGPAHVAAAVGTPVVSVFGPTVPAFGYVPYGNEAYVVEHAGLSCRPCHRHGPRVCPLGHFRCMREISAETVIHRVDLVLGGGLR